MGRLVNEKSVPSFLKMIILRHMADSIPNFVPTQLQESIFLLLILALMFFFAVVFVLQKSSKLARSLHVCAAFTVVLLPRGEHALGPGVQVLHPELHEAGLAVRGGDAAGAVLPAGGGDPRRGLDPLRRSDPLLPQPDRRQRAGKAPFLSHLWKECSRSCTVFALQINLNLCIPRKGIARPQSQFPHSCLCARFMYSQDQSTKLHIFPCSRIGRLILEIYKYLTDICMSVGTERQSIIILLSLLCHNISKEGRKHIPFVRYLVRVP